MKIPDLSRVAFTRRLIALSVTITACVGFLQGKVSVEAFMALASVVVTFYFTKAQVNELLRNGHSETTNPD